MGLLDVNPYDLVSSDKVSLLGILLMEYCNNTLLEFIFNNSDKYEKVVIKVFECFT
jgi:hypothetical protein